MSKQKHDPLKVNFPSFLGGVRPYCSTFTLDIVDFRCSDRLDIVDFRCSYETGYR
jgi:hypothetical protein